jgi:hypothetical protein
VPLASNPFVCGLISAATSTGIAKPNSQRKRITSTLQEPETNVSAIPWLPSGRLANRVPITSTENESLHRQSGIGAFYEPGCSCDAKVSSRLITTSFSTTQCTKSGLAVVSTIGQISRPASLTMHSASEAMSRRVRGVFNSGNLRRLFWSYRVTRSCNDSERSRGGLESPQQLSPSPRIRT